MSTTEQHEKILSLQDIRAPGIDPNDDSLKSTSIRQMCKALVLETKDDVPRTTEVIGVYVYIMDYTAAAAVPAVPTAVAVPAAPAATDPAETPFSMAFLKVCCL